MNLKMTQKFHINCAQLTLKQHKKITLCSVNLKTTKKIHIVLTELQNDTKTLY